MAIELKSANDLARSKGIKCLVYGESGIGKTMLAATCAKSAVISIEPGIISLRNKNIERVFGKAKDSINYGPQVLEVASLEAVREAIDWAVSSESDAFDTIIVDSLSEYGQMLLLDATAKLVDGRQIYGDIQTKILKFINLIKKASGKNFVVLAHARWYPSNDNEPEMCGPALPGKQLGRSLVYEFDEVFQMKLATDKKGVEKRCFKTFIDSYGYAKDRSGTLRPIEIAHLDTIFKKIVADE